MAIGDDAQAAGMPLVPANGAVGSPGKVKQGWQEFNRTRDFIANFFDSAKAFATGLVAPINTDLGGATATATEGKLVRFGTGGRLNMVAPLAGANPATKQYVDDAIDDIPTPDLSSKVSKSGDTMTGHLYLPNSVAATSGYTTAFINGDGRVSRGASSSRYKKNITRSPELPDMFAVPISSYVMRGDPLEDLRYGPIAEDLAKDEALRAFVVFDEQGRPESFDMMSYLFAAVAQLAGEVKELRGD